MSVLRIRTYFGILCFKQNHFKTQELPLARIKKIMKQDEEVKMISAEVCVMFATLLLNRHRLISGCLRKIHPACVFHWKSLYGKAGYSPGICFLGKEELSPCKGENEYTESAC